MIKVKEVVSCAFHALKTPEVASAVALGLSAAFAGKVLIDNYKQKYDVDTVMAEVSADATAADEDISVQE